MTTAFVTGITGQDGTILAARLAGEGVDVHGLVQTADEVAARRSTFPAGVTLHIGELVDRESLVELVAGLAPDEIYNLGGISSVGFSWEHPGLTGAVSGLGAVYVLEAALASQQRSGKLVRVVQASSAEIFGAATQVPQDELTPVAPITPYGAAKAYAHQMARVFRSCGLFAATCIFYNHESTLRPSTFVTRKITMAAARIAHDGDGTLTLGDLSVSRDWGWAPDYVDAMVRAVRHERPDDFVVASGQPHTVEDFVEAAMVHAGVAGWRAHVETDPAFVRPADATEQVGDATKARTVLGWAPTVTFGQMVGLMVDHDLQLLEARA